MVPAEEADIQAIIKVRSILLHRKALTEPISAFGSRQLEMSLVVFADLTVSN